MTVTWACTQCGWLTVVASLVPTDTKPVVCGHCMSTTFTKREAAA